MFRLTLRRLLPAFAPFLLPVIALAAEFEIEGRSFTLPDGFKIERIAGPPLVDRPITAAFDEQGRLYVADSSGSNDKVEIQLEQKPHRILRLEDTNGDGQFDSKTIFADRMMFPEGTLWHDGSLYVAAPPQIWKLTDTTGDGVADVREIWFDGKTLTGCANDLHGPYLGLDGWIYWCKGAFAEQTYERPGQKPFVTKASHIFRRRADGQGIVEPVMTGGMDNPVDVVFTPGGERIFTTTFLQRPGGGNRDGLIHAVYGGVYGKDHGVLDGHIRTSPDLMPVLAHTGPSAPCGLERYDSDVFGQEFQDNLFACQFNMHKVTRHVLEPDGATFRSTDEDFLVGSELDFHPTDVLTDADGSLIVVDTGGWYKLCCPTSQLAKPDVLGAIYRIRREGAEVPEDPRGLAIAWEDQTPEQLASLLDDARPAVRQRAIETLASLGEAALPALEQSVRTGTSAQARRNAVWALTRIDAEPARKAVRLALPDKEETVRQAAIHSISVHRDAGAINLLNTWLNSPLAHDRRASAEALGRLGDPAAVPGLLQAISKAGDDRVLEHSLIYALIEIGDPDAILAGLSSQDVAHHRPFGFAKKIDAAKKIYATLAGLSSQDVARRRAALIALDQMEGGTLDPETVLPFLTASDPGLKETAAWIVGRHPDWAPTLTNHYRERLAEKDLSSSEEQSLEDQLSQLAGSETIQNLLAEPLRSDSASPQSRRISLRAMTRAGLSETPSSWVEALTRTLQGNDPDLLRQAASTARALPMPDEGVNDLNAELLKIGRNADHPADLRLLSLAAIAGGLKQVDEKLFAFLIEQLDPEGTVLARTTAADVLATARLDQEGLLELAQALSKAGPMEVNRLLPAFERSTDAKVGAKLLEALEQSPARSTLRVETLKPLLEPYGDDLAERAQSLYSALDADIATQAEQLERLLTELPKGNIRRGQEIFNGDKAACSSCHAIGYLGGKVGPDLTRIGQIRTGRDLLESIVYPSSSFVQSYESVVIATTDGRVFNGILKEDGPETVILTTGPDEEERIPRADIEEMQPGTVSIMPAGLDQQLTPQELADLVSFLEACR